MIITYKDVPRVTFPVFKIPSSNWYREDGLLFVDDRIVDDCNMYGATIGIRRMQSHMDIMPLKKSVDTHLGLIKQKENTYIDTAGNPFIYEKTLWCKLKYYSIRKVEQKIVACVLHLDGVKAPFTIPRPPHSDMLWAGILHLYELPWMLYEYSETKVKDSKRKV